jgi:hypothetical protein
MKKLIFLVVFVLFSYFIMNGQDYKNSLGFRAGLPFGPYGATIKHFLNKSNAVEGIVGSDFNGISATGLFQFEHWTGFYPGINWYWGLGAHAGFMDAGARWAPGSFTGGGVVGTDGIFGFEYTFDEIPINISVDILPSFNLVGYLGLNSISSGVSIRYVFDYTKHHRTY